MATSWQINSFSRSELVGLEGYLQQHPKGPERTLAPQCHRPPAKVKQVRDLSGQLENTEGAQGSTGLSQDIEHLPARTDPGMQADHQMTVGADAHGK